VYPGGEHSRNPENFTRFVLLIPVDREILSRTEYGSRSLTALTDLMRIDDRRTNQAAPPSLMKVSLALRLAHKRSPARPLEPFSRHGVTCKKIESRPIHAAPSNISSTSTLKRSPRPPDRSQRNRTHNHFPPILACIHQLSVVGES